MEEDDFIANTIQPPVFDCTDIIDQVVKRTSEKQHFNVINIIPQSTIGPQLLSP